MREWTRSPSRQMDSATPPRRAQTHQQCRLVYQQSPGPDSYPESMSCDDGAPPEVPPPVDVISAVIPPKPVLKQVRFGANSRPPVKAKVDGRPGWLTNLASDICFICFLAGHRSPNCQHQSRQVRDPESRNRYSEIQQAGGRTAQIPTLDRKGTGGSPSGGSA